MTMLGFNRPLPLYVAPLWPAGHLPHEGGDWLSSTVLPISNVGGWRKQSSSPISPHVGEMSGRTEGGAVERESPRHNLYRNAGRP